MLYRKKKKKKDSIKARRKAEGHWGWLYQRLVERFQIVRDDGGDSVDTKNLRYISFLKNNNNIKPLRAEDSLRGRMEKGTERIRTQLFRFDT